MKQAQATIHYASASGPNGAVVRGPACTKAEAVAWRQRGFDIVICGDDVQKNALTARQIEAAAVGEWKENPPHARSAGPMALPHVQPRHRPPAGHTFFETKTLKAQP